MSNTPLPRLYGPADSMSSPPADVRERAVAILTDAYAYDVISDVEFERRLARLSSAVTPSDLESVVGDLVGARAPVHSPVPSYAGLAPTQGRVTGFMSETRRKGPWRVPQHLLVRAIMCDMKIDLRYAAVPPGCVIEVKSVMASVAIIVPPGMSVDFNVDPIMGAAGSDASGSAYGDTHVTVRGSAIMSDVRVRTRTLSR